MGKDDKMKEAFFILYVMLFCFVGAFAACNPDVVKQWSTEETSTKIKQVTIYSTSWCGWCVKAKKFLDDYGVKYTEKSLESKEDREELVKIAEKLGYNGELNAVPLFIIGNEIIVGFNPKELICKIGLKKCTLQHFQRVRSELRSH